MNTGRGGGSAQSSLYYPDFPGVTQHGAGAFCGVNADLITARCLLIATEGRYHAAHRAHRASKHLRREWMLAKARVAALEARQ